MPMSTRGFARSCCDVYPKEYGKYTVPGGTKPTLFGSVFKALLPSWYRRPFFEAGVASDPYSFFKREHELGRSAGASVVYVVTPDLSAFVRVFLRLPASARVTLVTGSEDIGAPWEIFHPNRTDYFDYNFASLWPGGQPVSMRDFIADPRLVRWFA